MTNREKWLREAVEAEREIFSRLIAPERMAEAQKRYNSLRAALRMPPYTGDWREWPRDRVLHVWDRETFRCTYCTRAKHQDERARPLGVPHPPCCSSCKPRVEMALMRRVV